MTPRFASPAVEAEYTLILGSLREALGLTMKPEVEPQTTITVDEPAPMNQQFTFRGYRAAIDAMIADILRREHNIDRAKAQAIVDNIQAWLDELASEGCPAPSRREVERMFHGR